MRELIGCMHDTVDRHPDPIFWADSVLHQISPVKAATPNVLSQHHTILCYSRMFLL